MQSKFITPIAAVLLAQYASALTIETGLNTAVDTMQSGEIAESHSVQQQVQLAQQDASDSSESSSSSSSEHSCMKAARKVEKKAIVRCRRKYGRGRKGKKYEKLLKECLASAEESFEATKAVDCEGLLTPSEPDEPEPPIDDSDGDGDGDGDGDVCDAACEEEKKQDAEALIAFNQVYVDAHNRQRFKHHSPDLVYDADLAAGAMEYAKKLYEENLWEPSPEALAGDFGELLGEGHTFRGRVSPEALYQWYDQVNNYNFQGDPDAVDHKHWWKVDQFAQVVWKATTKIGCGYASKEHGEYVVCRYDVIPVDGQYADNIEKKWCRGRTCRRPSD